MGEDDGARVASLLAAMVDNDSAAFVTAFDACMANAVHPNGQSWLHLLAKTEMLDALDVALKYCDQSVEDVFERTPLMVAAARGNTDVCVKMLATGLVQDEDIANSLRVALRHNKSATCRAFVTQVPNEVMQVLLAAINRDDALEIQRLLEAGLNPDAGCTTGKRVQFAVHEAATRPAVLRELISHTVDVNMKDSAGRTPLSLAAAAGHAMACSILLDAGASWIIKDHQGRSPMYHACEHERDVIIKTFLKLGDSVNTTDSLHQTPLLYHAERGNMSGCLLLLRYNADVRHQNASGWTAMHLAAAHGHKSVCRALLSELTVDLAEANSVNEDTLCRPVLGLTGWTAVTVDALLRIYGELITIGAKATRLKYGTLMIRDYAMNTLLHLAAIHATDTQCAYLIRCILAIEAIPANIQNCYCKTALDTVRDRQMRFSVNLLLNLEEQQMSRGSSSFRVQLGSTLSRSVAVATPSSVIAEFTECSRARLLQLCRGIENDVYSCGTDEIVCQTDCEHGDSVLHFFIRDYCRRGSFPSVEIQRAVLLSASWLGTDSRMLRAFINKRNWEGKTPLHLAAEVGALGFHQALLEKGAAVGEECSGPNKRLLDQPSQNIQFWKPVNFAVAGDSSWSILPDTESQSQRIQLIELLLRQPDALPTDESALRHCQDTIHQRFPHLLPKFLQLKEDFYQKEDMATAKELYLRFLDECYGAYPIATTLDPSGVTLHKLFLDTESIGIHVLDKYVVNQCIIESTGDTLLHLVVAHGHSAALSLLRYLITEGSMDINRANKQLQTPLHIACDRRNAEICLFLLSNGADVTASCQNLKEPTVNPWFTPLYSALWSAEPSYEIIELLLSTPKSIIDPRNPRLGRSDAYTSANRSAKDVRWNDVVLKRLTEVHPSALPLFLDHFNVEVNRLSGGILFQFMEVRQACENLQLVLSPSAMASSKYSPSSCVTHPVIRNAIHLKWKLFGSRSHRRQLALYSLMLVLFYLSNVILPKLEVADPGVAKTSRFKWRDFESTVDYVVAVCKAACWWLALYHLVYVELFLEWRSDKGRYWRSLWNLLDIVTYLMMLVTIPLEVLNGWDTLRECLLSILSILLCVNLMQALLVSSFFSVLIFTFARMCRVVAQFIFHYLLLLVGFTGGFHLLFHGKGPHMNFMSSMRVVFLATFGELNYEQNFLSPDNEPARNACAFLLLVLYVIVVMIVALNLMTALMTSEYENVRSQAEERALLELAGALHRYEQWLGADVIKALYDSPRGEALLAASKRRIPMEQVRRRFGSRHASVDSFDVHPLTTRWKRALRQPAFTSMIHDKHIVPLRSNGVDGDVSSELSRRWSEEVGVLRREVASKLEEMKEAITAVSTRVNANGTSDVLAAKLDAVLERLDSSHWAKRS
ncbi:hypothetical protein Poli38472_006352 [Pythium oligandrum]|uniref:Ion transport domain-containing protein n=1 Tax=Pythium oligandrum TaxID=41045 RepID=A0A8K1FE77_PYTOL|nr:hypothetical protein Poli38472_006352 [Pythium oligandrum]|eukprot:TMW56342.1 hypothetical protein Poli38472_006352 [Pythium oligandrum]